MLPFKNFNFQYCATYKIKGIHIINGGTVFEKALPIFQPFLKSEIVAMVNYYLTCFKHFQE